MHWPLLLGPDKPPHAGCVILSRVQVSVSGWSPMGHCSTSSIQPNQTKPLSPTAQLQARPPDRTLGAEHERKYLVVRGVRVHRSFRRCKCEQFCQ